MIRNLKAPGLALCAIFIIGALSASAASAANDVLTSASGSGTTYITGTQVGSSVFGSKSSGGTVVCTSATYKGEYTGTTASKVELTPLYTGCKIGTKAVSVTDNNCKFVLTGETDAFEQTDGTGNGEATTVKLNCGDTGSIIVDGPVGCVITYTDTHPAKTEVNRNLLGIKYDNEADGPKWDVKATFIVDHVTFTSNASCMPLGFIATDTAGYLTTNVTLRAYEDTEHTKQANLTWS